MIQHTSDAVLAPASPEPLRGRSVTDRAEAAPGQADWIDGPVQGQLPDGVGVRCTACDMRGGQLRAPEDRPMVTSPEAAAQVLLPVFAGADRERCLAALLDTKHRLVDLAVVSVGSIDHTFMSPREVFRDALLGNAAAVVLAHNHPSGDTEPSDDDERVTRRLVRAGELVGIEVLDHLIVAGPRWVSLARRGVV